ncbi:MAG TPA: molybdopterin-dependent oxidoreductase [Thermoanaerobaculia bacterium]|nr:molybdopterin-dependent oxidoreductase [Thermoanaerobaculia bacterium]
MTERRETDPTDPQAALSRRDLFRLGLLAGSASLVTACGWQGGPLVPKLRAFSRVNDWVGEKLFLSSSRLSREYPVSQRTPERSFPTYARTRGFPRLEDPSAWALQVGGLVRNPLRLTLEMIQAMPSVTYTFKHHCVEGWTAIGTWTGVPVQTIVSMAQPTGDARYLRFDSFDARYSNGWDLKSAMHPQTILAYAFNDRPLDPARGAPLRLYSPVKLGYKLTKYLTAMTFTTERPGGYWEDLGYPWFGGI